MKKISVFIIGFCWFQLSAQDANKVLNLAELTRIQTILSADEMQGRKTFSPGIDKAANFIADEFAKAGLKTWNQSGTYLQKFALVRTKLLSLECKLDGVLIDNKQIVVASSLSKVNLDEKGGYEQVQISAGANLFAMARTLLASNKNSMVWVDPSFANSFGNLIRMKSQLFKSDYTVVFVLAAKPAVQYQIAMTQEVTELPLANVVGVLPGKSKPNEYVIFSGHYDHLGVMAKDRQGNLLPDSIFNGANDDAAGTTAVMMLAKYYQALKQNERTLVFAAFTAEEIGGYGSQFFSKQFPPEQVVAMFNIEMIGTESKWGKNSAYITGFEKTNMGKMLQENLQGSSFQFYPDPYPDQQLFYRSDNATLARLGVPAHTISTSKMDNEPNYHKASDEIGTLDLENMVQIVKAIALSAKGIVSGKQTPSRVDVGALR